MFIISFFVAHYFLALFSQTFYVHRYAAHRMFKMNLFWERFFHVFAWVTQGFSYLNPRAYALLHRMHHAYSDTERDPHSPDNFSNAVSMMWATFKRFNAIGHYKELVEKRFEGGYPRWPLMEKIGDHWLSMTFWALFYAGVYWKFATHWWMWLLLPAHFFMGPIHGAIVNWCGHRYGYRNFPLRDSSRNTLAIDFLTMGELFQNNHHRLCTSANFAVKWYEFDPTYAIIKVLAALKVLTINKSLELVSTLDAAEQPWGVPVDA
ncbi:MAG: acyl-CoA desaturase [Elusimicrobia bacterium]|nr:acyl-CoA desaturase [Elusimicrobiota bacterium]